MSRQLARMMEPIADDWRERLEVGSSRLPLPERTALLERRLVNHESFDEIMASWDAEIARRIDEYEAGRTEGIPAEVVLAKMREIVRRPKNPDPPPIRDTYRKIRDQGSAASTRRLLSAPAKLGGRAARGGRSVVAR